MTGAHIARALVITLAVVAMFAVVAALLIGCGRGPAPCHPASPSISSISAIGHGGDAPSKRCEARK